MHFVSFTIFACQLDVNRCHSLVSLTFVVAEATLTTNILILS